MTDFAASLRPGRCFIIAEAGSNHDGKLEQALQLIDVAAQAGADAVKFQLFTAADLYPRNVGSIDTLVGEIDFYDVLEKSELPLDWLPALRTHAAQAGILLLFSPFSLEAVDILVDNDAPAIKVASPELSHIPLLRHVGTTGLAVILSTGMSAISDIDEALLVLSESGAHAVSLLHCVTAYPCPPEDSNLAVIPALAAAFAVPVGLSDHTIDALEAPLVAVSVGAQLLEKHFTLSRELSGPDHPFAIEPIELTEMVKCIRELEKCELSERRPLVESRIGVNKVSALLGNSRKVIAPAERELATCDRRSIHAISDIAVGEAISSANVAILRGERNLVPGLHPRYLDEVLGALVHRAIPYGKGLEWDDVLTKPTAGNG